MLDPREVLAVPRAAPPAEVRRACAVLVEHLTARGAPEALVQLVVAARDAALTGGLVRAASARALLGVPPTASQAEMRAAWRRVAAMTHPDRGGTAALFRAVTDAHDALTRRGAARRPRAAAQTWRYTPPPKPPPPPPFRAPPPSERLRPRPVTAALDLVTGAVTLLVWLVVAAVGLIAVRTPLLSVPALIACIVNARTASSSVRRIGRAVVRLRPPKKPIPDAASPSRFLEEVALDVPVGREPHERVWSEYVKWCHDNGSAAIPPRRFIEELRSYGLLFVEGDVAEPRWVGLRFRRSAF